MPLVLTSEYGPAQAIFEVQTAQNHPLALRVQDTATFPLPTLNGGEVLGNERGAAPAPAHALTPTAQANILREEAIVWNQSQTFNNAVVYSSDQVEGAALPLTITLSDTVSKLFITTNGDGEVLLINGTSTPGREVRVYLLGTGLKTFRHATGAGGMRWPFNRDHLLGLRQSFRLVGQNPSDGWRVMDVPPEASGAAQQLGWAPASLGNSNLLTLLPNPHPAGLYLISSVFLVRTAATGTAAGSTLAWTSPTFGAESQAMATALTWAATGTQLAASQRSAAIRSAGTAAVTLQFNAGVISAGAPVADLYASARRVD